MELLQLQPLAKVRASGLGGDEGRVRILHEEGKSVPVLLTLSVSLDVGLPFFCFFAREKKEKSNRFPFGTVSREDTV